MAEVIAWDVKLRPNEKGKVPFRTIVFAASRPLAVQAANLAFTTCEIVEPPRKRVPEQKPEDLLA